MNCPASPLVDGTDVVYDQGSHAGHILSSDLVALLLRCEAFSPLPEHARALGRELGLGAAESRGLGDELAQLAGSGLLDRAARPPPPLPGTGRGSETASGREDARRMLADLGQRHGAAIVYAGEEGKRRFARALREEAAVPPDTVDFALFDAEGCGRKNGGNVNALVLHAAETCPPGPASLKATTACALWGATSPTWALL